MRESFYRTSKNHLGEIKVGEKWFTQKTLELVQTPFFTIFNTKCFNLNFFPAPLSFPLGHILLGQNINTYLLMKTTLYNKTLITMFYRQRNFPHMPNKIFMNLKLFANII